MGLNGAQVTRWYLRPDSFIWHPSLPCVALACPGQLALQEQLPRPEYPLSSSFPTMWLFNETLKKLLVWVVL